MMVWVADRGGEYAMFNGLRWMYWIYICLNVIAVFVVKGKAKKGMLNHISP